MAGSTSLMCVLLLASLPTVQSLNLNRMEGSPGAVCTTDADCDPWSVNAAIGGVCRGGRCCSIDPTVYTHCAVCSSNGGGCNTCEAGSEKTLVQGSTWLQGCCPTGTAWQGGYYGCCSPPGETTCSSSSSGSATGDPHLQNVHGQRFDLMKPGRHVLINIPRGVRAEEALIRVEAEARQVSERCADMYFQVLNISGTWAEEKHAGGYHYESEGVVDETPAWMTFGQIEMKVVHGHSQQGTKYLNFYVKHLGRTGLLVGGLLGEDDHSDAATPSQSCRKRVALGAETADAHGRSPRNVSAAVAQL